MTAELDAAYRSQRQRLSSVVVAGAAQLWARAQTQDEDGFVGSILPLVRGGQAQTVALTDAYMAAKTDDAVGEGRVRGLDANDYSIERLRGRPAEDVYRQPFAAAGAALARGAPFGAAMRGPGAAAVAKLARTDLQLAQTHAARDWMAQEPRIIGYRRVLSGGRNCGLCVAASTQRYWKEDLLPIHERCGCSVSPLYGTEPAARTIDPDTWRVVASEAEGDLSARRLSQLEFDNEALPGVLRVSQDAELGLRLVDERWAAAA